MSKTVEKEQIASQVERIANSKEFCSSRQLREFLRFVSQRAIEGTTHLDQYEIADAVLNRSTDFNPLDDASVRRLATLTRQRLTHYYSDAGSHDPILVSLPLRSYLPEFRERDLEALIPELPSSPPPSWPAKRWIALMGAALVLATGTFVWWRHARRENPALDSSTFVLKTVRGDIYGANLDLPGEAIRLGPTLGTYGEATVRMRFTPEVESHQAGLVLWKDADHYIKVGRRFTARSSLEFAIENDATYKPAERMLHYDPDGQSGEPVWLSLRRRDSRIAAFASRDGLAWQSVGDEIEVPFELATARVGLYSFHGRRAATSIEAVFDRFGIGPTFALGESGAGRWLVKCPANSAHEYAPPVLRTNFLAAPDSCFQALQFQVPPGDWSYATQVDFPATPGVSAGMVLRGDKGSIRVVRHFTSEPTVALIHESKDLSSVRDFPGSPRLILRLSATQGFLSASFSRDGRTFHALPKKVALSELGSNAEIGISHATGPWGVPHTVPSAEFYYLRRELTALQNFR